MKVCICFLKYTNTGAKFVKKKNMEMCLILPLITVLSKNKGESQK